MPGCALAQFYGEDASSRCIRLALASVARTSVSLLQTDFFLQTTGISYDAFLEMLKSSEKNYDKFGAMMSAYIGLGNSRRLNYRTVFVGHIS